MNANIANIFSYNCNDVIKLHNLSRVAFGRSIWFWKSFDILLVFHGALHNTPEGRGSALDNSQVERSGEGG